MRNNDKNKLPFNEYDSTEEIIRMFEERTRSIESHANRNEPDSYQDAIEIEPVLENRPERKKKGLDMAGTLTKSEHLIMWGLLVLLMIVCSVTIQNSLLKQNVELSDRIENLEYQLIALRADNAVLAEKIGALSNNGGPINITVNVDGVNKDFTYDENGNIIDPSQPSQPDQPEDDGDEDFDTMTFRYSDYEAANIMLGYVNELRESVGVAPMQLDVTLIEKANIAAKQYYEAGSKPYTGVTGNYVDGGNSIRHHFEKFKNGNGYYNMVNASFKYFGYVLYKDPYGGGNSLYAVQLFWDGK